MNQKGCMKPKLDFKIIKKWYVTYMTTFMIQRLNCREIIISTQSIVDKKICIKPVKKNKKKNMYNQLLLCCLKCGNIGFKMYKKCSSGLSFLKFKMLSPQKTLLKLSLLCQTSSMEPIILHTVSVV